MKRSSKHRLPLVLPLALLLALLAPTGSSLSPPFELAVHAAAAAEASGRSMACTVKRLEPDARRLDAIIGVGYALRLVTMDLAPDCRASAEGRAVPLEAIRPGDVVRVRYEAPPAAQGTRARRVVTEIEVILPAPKEGRR